MVKVLCQNLLERVKTSPKKESTYTKEKIKWQKREKLNKVLEGREDNESIWST